MIYENIPTELKELNQWVCCKEATKIPMRATEPYAASSSDPKTWSEYSNAFLAVAHGAYDYLGFVFDNNGIVGIDIDIAFTDENKFFLNDMTRDIITKCQSYTELSKSGRGFHIFVKGVLPFSGKNNRKGLEIYQDSRFFVMTGKKRFYSEIIENQEAIDYIVGTYFQEDKVIKQNDVIKPTFYKPVMKKKGSVLSIEYPAIQQGCRNNSLLSLAGQLLSAGYNTQSIYKNLSYVNKVAVIPSLKDSEVKRIVQSVLKYR